MTKATKIDWHKVQVVIFDVDGTLYAQSKLRKKMLFALLKHYVLRPWKFQDLLILHHFRSEREKMAGYDAGDLENAQYEWCARKGGFSVGRVRKVIDYWMFNFPNKYLAACVHPGVKLFFETLRRNNIKIAIYSDYKAVDKLRAMGLKADVIVSSTDAEIDLLKPNPRGLRFITEKLRVAPSECLFIGDRQELDGACAINANMPYLIVDKKPFKEFDFYSLIQEQVVQKLENAPMLRP